MKGGKRSKKRSYKGRKRSKKRSLKVGKRSKKNVNGGMRSKKNTDGLLDGGTGSKKNTDGLLDGGDGDIDKTTMDLTSLNTGLPVMNYNFNYLKDSLIRRVSDLNNDNFI